MFLCVQELGLFEGICLRSSLKMTELGHSVDYGEGSRVAAVFKWGKKKEDKTLKIDWTLRGRLG